MARKKLYFAHPINTYDTPLENKMLELIRWHFPVFDIENPNQPKHQENYKKGGMDYFYGVMNGCKGGSVAAPFLDGVVGAGVAGEMIYHLNAGKAVWLIEAPRLIVIRPLFAEEILMLLRWDKMMNVATSKEILEMVENDFVLSIETTRKRTWEVLYEKKRPYEESHLII